MAVLLTPPAHSVLSGVTRDIVVALAAADGIPLRESAPDHQTVSCWDECFITSTSRHVMPVTVVDGTPVSHGVVGPVTHRLMALFKTYFADVLRPASAGDR